MTEIDAIRADLAAWSVGKPKAVRQAVLCLDGWLNALSRGPDPDFEGEGVSVLSCTAGAVERLRLAALNDHVSRP